MHLPAAGFDGERALKDTATVVGFGPRHPGSEASRKTREYIKAQLKPLGCAMAEDPFTASTPNGPMKMTNLIARCKGGNSGRAVVFTGHYDTKIMPGRPFVGANDGGSSTGFLIELARQVAARKNRMDVWFVWFDGEEAIGPWSETDGVHGSRHLARKWSEDGTLGRIAALINIDMIGDRDLGILQEYSSSASLKRLIWSVARDLGYGKHFLNQVGAVEDDHSPFLRLGVNAIDLIDFDYGPDNAWWHTEGDTMDKLSARSFKVVGDVLLETLRRLEQ